MIANAENMSLEPSGDALTAVAPHARLLAEDDFSRDVWSVFGLPIDLVTAPQAVELIEISARDRRPLAFVTPNVNFLIRCLNDPNARREVIDSDLSLIDGAPLVVLGRFAGVPIRERCAGSDVFAALRLRPGFPGRRLRVFFFGGRDGAAKAAAEKLNAEKRGVEAAGFLNPGHGDVESMSRPEIINEINAAEADFVLVALGAAKGQRWIDQNRAKLNAPVIAHLGAVMDFVAGTIRRAPRWVARTGLEWAWRIKEEPSLWRRYWTDGAALAGVMPQLMSAALTTRLPARRAGDCRAHAGNGLTVIELVGDLSVRNRDLARAAFRTAARADGDVILDLAQLRRVDASVLGQILMLEKAIRARGGAIAVRNQSKRMRRLFAAHAMNYRQATDQLQASGPDWESIAAAV